MIFHHIILRSYQIDGCYNASIMYNWLKRHLIPHEGNDYKPHLLEEVAMFGLLCLVLISFSVANIQSLLLISSDWLVGAILPAVVAAETNEERSDEAIPILVRSKELDRAATMKAEHMAAGEYFAHYSPEGISPWYWFNEVSYDYLHAGENLAIHFTDSGEVVDAWMDSPTHRDNIMNEDYREIGIGTARGEYRGHSTVYVVQLFGTPRERIIAAEERVTTVAPTTESQEIVTAPVNDSNGEVLAAQEGGSTLPTEASDTPDVELVSPAETVAVAQVTSDRPSPPRIPSDVLEHVSTSTVGTVAYTIPVATGGETTQPILSFVTKPYKVLQWLYVLIGFLVAFSLAVSITLEIRTHHPRHVAYSTGLMALMVALLYVHLVISGGVIIA